MVTRQGDAKMVIGLIRVSTTEQLNGPEAQRVELELWCKTHDAELVAVYEERGVSGGAPLDRRPILMDAIAALRDHGAGVLLVSKRDRLARDVVVSAVVEKLVERNGAAVVTANGAGNGNGPEAQLMRTILDAFAQFERSLIKARTRAALAVKRSRGERLGGHLPYGKELAADGRHLAPNQDEQEAARVAREHRAAGRSLRWIARHLESRGIRNRGGRRWHAQSIRHLLRSAA